MRRSFLQGSFLLLLLFFAKTSLAAEDIVFGFYTQGDDINFWGDKIDTVFNKNTFKDGVNCPRARFYVRGNHLDWHYFLNYDAAQEVLRESFLRYQGIPHFLFYIGQFKIPYNLWFSTAHRDIDFLERELANNAFIPGLRIGLQSKFLFDPFTLGLTLTGPEANNRIHGNQVKGRMPLAYNTRLVFAPIKSEQRVLHFAAAAIFQETDSLGRFRFRTFPEVQTYHNRFLVDTDYFYQCKNYIGQEFEALALYHSVFFETEYFKVKVNRLIPNANFEGGSCELGVFLTGEHYVYDFREGRFDRISKIKHTFGAFQFCVRYSAIDLMSEQVQGGREHNVTFGLAWILKNVKFMANYIIANADPACNGVDRHLRILGLRCQICGESCDGN